MLKSKNAHAYKIEIEKLELSIYFYSFFNDKHTRMQEMTLLCTDIS